MKAVETFGGDMGVKPACEALGLSRATYYRNKAGAGAGEKSTPAAPTSSRAPSSEERKEVVDLRHGERFMDQAPHEINATLLDEGRYCARFEPCTVSWSRKASSGSGTTNSATRPM